MTNLGSVEGFIGISNRFTSGLAPHANEALGHEINISHHSRWDERKFAPSLCFGANYEDISSPSLMRIYDALAAQDTVGTNEVPNREQYPVVLVSTCCLSSKRMSLPI